MLVWKWKEVQTVSSEDYPYLYIDLSYHCFPFWRFKIIAITTGAQKIDVTVLIFSTSGAKAVLAIRSLSIQKTAPPRNVPGITTSGLDVFSACFTRCGTAIHTKEIGHANAVTVADNTHD